MNYTLQIHGERMVYPMPPGLYELMSDITREVLRDQPTMVYKYIAHYLETLVKVREHSRTADTLVTDIIAEDQEILAFVDSLGVGYEEADIAARKIQRAFRKYRAKKMLELEVKAAKERLMEVTFSESFQEFLDSLGIDLDEAERASEVIQNAYRVYQSKKKLEERKLSKDASTHTIDVIRLKYPLKKKTPQVRDSKLMVYQQSPKQSIESTWSTLARRLAEEEGKWKPPIRKPSAQFVYEQDEPVWKEKVIPPLDSEIPATTNISDDKVSLPSYYESQPKIPMISESGLLDKEVDDIVTLFSTDSIDDDHRSQSVIEPLHSLASLSKGSSKKKQEMAKELFQIISGKSSTSLSKSLHSLQRSQSELASQNMAKTSSPMQNDGSLLVKKPSEIASRAASQLTFPGRFVKAGSSARFDSNIQVILEEDPPPSS